MASLVIIAKAGGGLTYDDDDIVTVIPADQNPGSVVTANTPPRFLFLYITDRDVGDADIQGLLAPHEGDLVDENDPDRGRVSLGKRCTCCVLPGPLDTACQTYHAFDDAPGQVKMTWAQFQALTTQKGH